MKYWIIGMIVFLLFCLIYVAWERKKIEKTMEKLDLMINQAIDGCFEENAFDESKLSSLESKLNRYLLGYVLSEKNLEQERDNIKTLIADISHQTKIPISNIILYSNLLSERQGQNEEDCKCIEEILFQSEKLNFLIQNLVKISRLETGIISVAPQRNPVNPMIKHILTSLKKRADAKQVSLDAQEEQDVEAVFDPKWTEEAIFNIVDNAIKYTPSGGKVLVSVIMYSLFCRIDIEDTGRGIEESETNKVFKRFYRSPSVSQYEGVGIGLYLSNKIVSKQGGYLKVTSQVGKGSTFSVFLPGCSS